MPPKVPSVQRLVKFHEIRNEAGQRVKQIDYQQDFFDVVRQLPSDQAQHYQGENGLRVRGRTYNAQVGDKPQVDLLILDRVHREPPFKYVLNGTYKDHEFSSDEEEFAEPKFLAFFERNIVASFTSGISLAKTEACLNTWRSAHGLAPITLFQVADADRLVHLNRIDKVQRIKVQLPVTLAAEIYRDRHTSLAAMMRSRKSGMVAVTLTVDVEDSESEQENQDELRFLTEDEVRYLQVRSSEDAIVEGTYFEQGSGRPHAHDFLGQLVSLSVPVSVPEPERGPEPRHASVALAEAFRRKQEPLFRIVPAPA